jgi:hypothetical protein
VILSSVTLQEYASILSSERPDVEASWDATLRRTGHQVVLLAQAGDTPRVRVWRPASGFLPAQELQPEDLTPDWIRDQHAAPETVSIRDDSTGYELAAAAGYMASLRLAQGELVFPFTAWTVQLASRVETRRLQGDVSLRTDRFDNQWVRQEVANSTASSMSRLGWAVQGAAYLGPRIRWRGITATLQAGASFRQMHVNPELSASVRDSGVPGYQWLGGELRAATRLEARWGAVELEASVRPAAVVSWKRTDAEAVGATPLTGYTAGVHAQWNLGRTTAWTLRAGVRMESQGVTLEAGRFDDLAVVSLVQFGRTL